MTDLLREFQEAKKQLDIIKHDISKDEGQLERMFKQAGKSLGVHSLEEAQQKKEQLEKEIKGKSDELREIADSIIESGLLR